MKNKDEIQRLISGMDSRLNLIEVKGDSVEHLLTARIMLKEILKIVEENDSETTKKEE